VVRYIASAHAAVLLIAVAYPVAQVALDWAIDGGRPVPGSFLASNLASNAVWALAMFGVLELGYRRSPRLWVAPLLAASGATVATLLVRQFVVSPLAGLPIGSPAPFLVSGIAGAALFALALTVGFRLAGWTSVELDDRPRGPISRSGYATALYVLLGVPLSVLMPMAAFDIRPETGGGAWGLGIALGVPLVMWAACFLRFVYVMWSGLPADQARMTPARAVGLLFIPLFNVYWTFQVFAGFAKDFNAVCARRNLPTPGLPVLLFAAYPIATFLTAVPVVGVWLTPASWVVLLAVVVHASNAVNSLDAGT
jgi:hypothetical protein